VHQNWFRKPKASIKELREPTTTAAPNSHNEEANEKASLSERES
jgi:hypothetical protein